MRALKYLALAGLLGAAVSVQAAPVTYKLDPSHTMVLFSWNHFGYSNPTADFGLGEGTLVFLTSTVSTPTTNRVPRSTRSSTSTRRR